MTEVAARRAEQAADIAERFWTTGELHDCVKWVNGRKLGWDFPMPVNDA